MSLALLAGGSAAVFWHRSRRVAALAPFASRYSPVEPRFEPGPVEDQATAPVAAGVEQVLPTSTPAPTPITLQPPVVAPQEAEPAPPILVPIDFSTGAPLMPGDGLVADDYSTPLKVVALHDAQQQSEFFCSLGQFDEAIAVLSSHLDESKDKPVLAFMELFRIYHGLGRRGDYEQLQSAFCTIFGIDVGGFDEYSDEQRELELYPVPLSRIAASWPAAASLDVIEKLLLKRPGSAREMLSIEAYRDLIWLYTLGQDVGRSTRLPAGLQLVGGTDLPNDHFILPWAFGDEQEPQELSLDRLNAIDVASHLSRFAVDIDLTASGGALQQSRLDDRKASDQVWTEAAAVRPLATETETETETETAAEAEAEDAFDAVMEYHSRKNAR